MRPRRSIDVFSVQTGQDADSNNAEQEALGASRRVCAPSRSRLTDGRTEGEAEAAAEVEGLEINSYCWDRWDAMGVGRGARSLKAAAAAAAAIEMRCSKSN